MVAASRSRASPSVGGVLFPAGPSPLDGGCFMSGHQPSHQPPPQLIDQNAVARALGISTRTVARWVSCGQLPAPLRLGAGPKPRLLWRLSEIEAYLARLEAAGN